MSYADSPLLVTFGLEYGAGIQKILEDFGIEHKVRYQVRVDLPIHTNKRISFQILSVSGFLVVVVLSFRRHAAAFRHDLSVPFSALGHGGLPNL